MITCVTSSGFTPARSIAAEIAIPPSSTAVLEARPPPSLPNGVRAPARITLFATAWLLTRNRVDYARFTCERPEPTALAVATNHRLIGLANTDELLLRVTRRRQLRVAERFINSVSACILGLHHGVELARVFLDHSVAGISIK